MSPPHPTLVESSAASVGDPAKAPLGSLLSMVTQQHELVLGELAREMLKEGLMHEVVMQAREVLVA
jgi:hypothetical protein